MDGSHENFESLEAGEPKFKKSKSYSDNDQEEMNENPKSPLKNLQIHENSNISAAEGNEPSGKFFIKYIKPPSDPANINEEDCSTSQEFVISSNLRPNDVEISAQYLPKDILVKIFSYLSRSCLMKCMEVCRNWQQVICAEVGFWRNYDLSDKQIDLCCLHRALQNGVENLTVGFSSIKNDEYGILESLDENKFRNGLERSDFSYSHLPYQYLQKILDSSSVLQHISLEGINLANIRISSLKKCIDLKTLNLAMTCGAKVDDLNEILSECINLCELNISWSSLVCNSANLFKFIAGHQSESLIAINLSGARDLLKDEMLFKLFQRFPQLKNIDISDSTEITGTIIQMIRNLVPELETLSISRCYKIPSRSYPDLSTVKKLKKLQVFGMFRAQTLSILQNVLPKVEINSEAFSSIARPSVDGQNSSRKVKRLWGVEIASNKYV